jgi:hypothetical protein
LFLNRNNNQRPFSEIHVFFLLNTPQQMLEEHTSGILPLPTMNNSLPDELVRVGILKPLLYAEAGPLRPALNFLPQ